MNDLFGVITFWSLVLAGYSVLPPATRAKVRLFVSWQYSLSVFVLTSLLNILLSLYPKVIVCAQPQICKQLSDADPSIIYGILSVYALIALWEIFQGSVGRRNIPQFKKSAEILYRKGLAVKEDPEGWSVLIDILHDNLESLFEIASSQELYRIIWYHLLINSIMPKDTFIYIFMPEEKQEKEPRKYIKKIGQIIKNKTIINVRRKLFNTITRNTVNTFFPRVPDSKSTKEAKSIISDYVIEKDLLKLSTKYKPDYIVKVLNETKKHSFEIVKIVDVSIKALLSNTESILYNELIEYNTPYRFNDYSYEGSKLLSIFFSKDNFVEKSELCTPILNFVDDYLKSLKNEKIDPFNSSEIHLYSAERFRNPILAGLIMYDWIVKTALRNDIKWHMFLQEVDGWVKYILINMTFTDTVWEGNREFPTQYAYILYEVFDTFRGWFRFVEDSEEIIVYDLKGMIDKNGNILQFTAETIVGMLKKIANSSMPEFHKISFADMVWRLYFELLNSKRKDLNKYGDYLLNCLTEKLTEYSSPFDYSFFKLLISSFYKLDVIGLHNTSMKQVDNAKQKLLDMMKQEIFPMLLTTDADLLERRAREFLSDGAYVNSDGIYIPSYYKYEKVLDFKDLGIKLETQR